LNVGEPREDVIEWLAHQNTSVVNYCEESNSPRIFASAFLSAATSYPGAKAEPPSAFSNCAETWFRNRAIAASRYAFFVHAVDKPSYSEWSRQFESPSTARAQWHNILSQFPVLQDVLLSIAHDVTSALSEAKHRFQADRERIRDTFCITLDDELVKVEAGLSDPHHGGRSVLRLVFASGMNLIYKPKPLAVEARVNTASTGILAGFGLERLRVLEGEGYGWVEYAGHPRRLDAPSDADVEALGRATALFWLLNATDLHVENVLPGPCGVRCLDLETLFAAPWIGAPPAIQHWCSHSVTSTLLFDASVFARGRIGNISGFDPTPTVGAFAPEIDFVIDSNRIVAQRTPLAAERRQPSLTAIDAKALIGGFQSACAPQARARVCEFIEGLPGDIPLRFVARETFFYAQTLKRSYQPRFLRDPAARRADFAMLAKGVSASGEAGRLLHKLVGDEVRQLERGDIPYFSYRLGEPYLHLSNGDRLLAFANSGQRQALAKVNEVRPSDFDEQQALLGVALGQGSPLQAVPAGEQASLLSLVATLAQTLHHAAFDPKERAARWLTLRGDVSKSDLRVAVGDTSFFAGSAGILLALQAAELNIDDPQLAHFLDRQAALWCQHTPTLDDIHPVLGFSGLGGHLLAAAELYTLAPKRWCALPGWIGAELDRIGTSISNDQLLDVIGGTAGLILGLDRVFNRLPKLQPTARALISEAQAHLVAQAQPNGATLHWSAYPQGTGALGYAHGWAGFASALMVGGTAQNDEALTRSAAWACDELHSALLSEKKEINWSWCNGATGFARGALAFASYERKLSLPSPLLRKAEDFAVEIRRRSMLPSEGNEPSRFCCGEMGLIDLTLDMVTSENGLKAVRQRIKRIVQSALARLSKSGSTLEPENAFPGLFQNLSGILYVACRALDPALVSLCGQRREELHVPDRLTK